MPPYWSLGFHLCRWGYGTANKTQEVVDKMRSLGIPQDVQWNDIDYMRDYLDFTYDKEKFGLLPQLVQHLHNNNQKYIMIVVGILESLHSNHNHAANIKCCRILEYRSHNHLEVILHTTKDSN